MFEFKNQEKKHDISQRILFYIHLNINVWRRSLHFEKHLNLNCCFLEHRGRVSRLGWKVAGSNLSTQLHLGVSLSKILNTKLLLMSSWHLAWQPLPSMYESVNLTSVVQVHLLWFHLHHSPGPQSQIMSEEEKMVSQNLIISLSAFYDQQIVDCANSNDTLHQHHESAATLFGCSLPGSRHPVCDSLVCTGQDSLREI